jgi:pyruvate,water dikinase
MLGWLGETDCHETARFGGKAANLSRLAAHHRVPPGFAVAADATSTVTNGQAPAELARAVGEAYGRLCLQTGETDTPVAVRSSAVDEDGAAASFAGQHDTYLNIRGRDGVVDALLRCVHSARTPEAVMWRCWCKRWWPRTRQR